VSLLINYNKPVYQAQKVRLSRYIPNDNVQETQKHKKIFK
jgi:hypothetical protein